MATACLRIQQETAFSGRVLEGDVQVSFPAVIQDKVKEAFHSASNSSIVRAASNIFRVAMQDPRYTTSLRGSSSTLSTVEEANGHGPSRYHLTALDELGMHGLLNHFQFLPAGRGHITVTKMVQWISELVSRIIE